MLFLLRLFLIVLIMYLLLRTAVRFVARRFLRQEWPFRSSGQDGVGPTVTGKAEETEYEVMETHIKESEDRA